MDKKFLNDLLNTRSPTGCEKELNDVVEKYVKPFVDDFKKDVLGNRIATLKGASKKTLMLASHSDEIGFIITSIDANGYLYFDKLGGHDDCMIAGRRVNILTKNGIVKGVTGKKAIHLMTPAERKTVPEIGSQWIDIGVSTKAEAQKLVRIGDSAVFEYSPVELSENRLASKALDDKAGCYSVFNALKQLSKEKKLGYTVCAVATTQEEIGTRGAQTSAFGVNPTVAIAVDVEHSSDYPTAKVGVNPDIKLGGGVVISRGPNMNPVVFERLVECAEKNKIAYQINAEARPTGTDARVIQMARSGIPTGLLGIPLRYMHTPSEVCDLRDLQACADLIAAFAKTLKEKDTFEY